MKPIKFKEYNVILPALKYDDEQGQVVTCWKLNLRERLSILIKGKLWISLFTFGKPITPIYPTTIKSELIRNDNK